MHRNRVDTLVALACLATLSALPGAPGCSKREVARQDRPADRRTRVGIYDSRCVAQAYWTVENRLDRHHGSLKERIQKATEAGNEKAAKQLEGDLWAHRKLLHKQVFSIAPIDDVLEHIADKLPAITKKAGVGVLVSKWDKVTLRKHQEDELVDVTDHFLEHFQLSAEQLKSIKDLQNKTPLSLEDVEKHIESGDI